MTREYKRLTYERTGEEGEALWLILNDEPKMNCLSETMQAELHEVLSEVALDNSIRCVVLGGAGEKVFCSGGDIKAFQNQNLVSCYDYLYQRGNSIQHLLTYMEKPVIAAVGGMCFAGGLELALACDFIYATQNAQFGLLEINLGVLAGWGGTVRLPRAISERRAKEMIYRGEIFDAEEAHKWGLVNRVFKTHEEMRQGLEQAVAEITSKPPLALRAAKNVVNNSLTCDSMEAALAIERGSIMWLSSSEDAQEGVAAFVEKRKPNFKGR